MNRRQGVARLAMALVIVAAIASTTSAQVTTGTLTTIKDPQGAVIPGATIGLTSDTRGTQLPDVVSNSSGDFTFVNVAPDVYTIQITMDGFKTLKRRRCTRQRRRPVCDRHAGDRSRRGVHAGRDRWRGAVDVLVRR